MYELKSNVPLVDVATGRHIVNNNNIMTEPFLEWETHHEGIRNQKQQQQQQPPQDPNLLQGSASFDSLPAASLSMSPLSVPNNKSEEFGPLLTRK